MADKSMEAAENALGNVIISDNHAIETLHRHYRTAYRVENILVHDQTDEQELFLFENEFFGRMLMLDGVTQLTTRDEPFYHELITHIPLFCHPSPQRMLVIGAGDGGVLREAVRHNTLQHIDLVEIDETVVRFSQQYLPSVSAGAFDDPRVHVTIADAAEFVAKHSGDPYDAVVVDSTDPFGPAAPLFEIPFYKNLAKIMSQDAVVMTQCGNPFVQPEELKLAGGRLADCFATMTPVMITVPTYTGGQMALGFGCKDKEFLLPSRESIKQKLHQLRDVKQLKVLNEDVFFASFALPNFVQSHGFTSLLDRGSSASL